MEEGFELWRVAVLGSGPSEGIPRVSCITRPAPSCRACVDSLRPHSKNRRRNTSLLLTLRRRQCGESWSEGEEKNILIDCGKFFWEGAIEWFPLLGVRSIDAVILTHDHFDAAGGLDNLRDWTMPPLCLQQTVPVYVRDEDKAGIAAAFPYLVEPSLSTGGGAVPALSFSSIADYVQFQIFGLSFLPVPIEHGRTTALAFVFDHFCYASDVKEVSDLAFAALPSSPSFLFVDCLREVEQSSHLSLSESVDLAGRMKAKRTFLIGIGHELCHDEVKAKLRHTSISPSFDGMILTKNEGGEWKEGDARESGR